MDATAALLTVSTVSTAGWAATACAAAHLVQRTRTDPLTGLPNREALTALTRRIARHPATAQAHRRPRAGGRLVGLLLIDLDRFKSVNDTHGHAIGDCLLRVVATRLVAVTGPGECPVRLHGDEFALWLGTLPTGSAGATGQHVHERAEAVRAALAQPVNIAPKSGGPRSRLVATASVGAAVLPARGLEVAALLAAADQAMYQAKRARYRAVPRITTPTTCSALEEDAA